MKTEHNKNKNPSNKNVVQVKTYFFVEDDEFVRDAIREIHEDEFSELGIPYLPTRFDYSNRYAA